MNTAMILAAGRGERLRPLTDTTPKALCVVHGMPLIERHVINLARAGISRIIINHAYLGSKIRQYLGDGSRYGVNLLYSPEPPGALETGGGIVNALPFIGKNPFITVNADIFTDFDFSTLSLPINSLAHYILIKKPSYYLQGDFGLSTDGFLTNDLRDFTFSGIACYDPILFKGLKPYRFSVIPLIRQQINSKHISGNLFDGTWTDIGTIDRLKEFQAAKKN